MNAKPQPWDRHFCQRHKDDDADESVPAQEFLDECPQPVRRLIFAVLQAVAEAPPPQFSGGGYWHAMHGRMKGLYEVRKKHRKTLYRLFCFLESPGTDVGLRGPAIIILCGLTKPDGTAMPESDYDEVLALYREALRRCPRSVVREAAADTAATG